MGALRLSAGVLFVLSMYTGVAGAADANPDQLFAEATMLINEEKFSEAIPKLEEAQRLDPGIGTQFNLAVCYAQTGRLAAAWKNFQQVEGLARAAGKGARADSARTKLDELRPRVSYASIRFADPTGVTVRIDGEVVATELSFVTLDAGGHALEAAAAGKQPFATTITITGEAQKVDVMVPVLEPVPTTPEIRTFTRETTNTRRTTGFVFGAVGLAGVAAAAVTGILVLGDKTIANNRCKPQCVTASGDVDTRGVDAVQQGKTLLPVNVVAWVVAGLGLGVGTYLLLTSATAKPATPTAQAIVVPTPDGRGAHAVLSAWF